MIGKIVAMLREKEEYTEYIKRMLDFEEKMPDRVAGIGGWEWHEVRVPTQVLNTLVCKNILEVTFSSGSTTAYKFINREEIKEAFNQFVAITLQPVAQNEKLTELPTDLFDIIIGYIEIKDLFLRSLCSTEPIHMLLIGSPATGKSLFLTEIWRLADSRYCLGGTSTKAGLVRFLIDYQPRLLLIDELEKMDGDDYSSLLSLMQTGIVTETKAGRTQTVQLKTKVYSACNTKRGIPLELLSRFAEFNLPEYTKDELRQVMSLTLVKRGKCVVDVAEYIADKLIAVGSNDVRDAVKVWRYVNAKDADKIKEDVDWIIQVLKKYGGGG